MKKAPPRAAKRRHKPNPLEELQKQFEEEKAEWEEEKQELEEKIVGLELEVEIKRREEDPLIPPTFAALNSTLRRVEIAHRVSNPL
jgi:hypothetical protein